MILKTFMARLPDETGTFLKAGKIISENCGKIVRISYNRSIDAHTVFIDVKADENSIKTIEKRFYEIGYFSFNTKVGLLLLEIELSDGQKDIVEIFSVIKKYKINISYISFRERKENYQKLKLGILPENIIYTIDCLKELAQKCKIRILKNNVTEKNVDNTVFYIEFAQEIKNVLNLSKESGEKIAVYSNEIMQNFDERSKNPIKTFEYIKRFSVFIAEHRKENFKCEVYKKEITNNTALYLFEPPCGSNIFVVEYKNKLMFTDGGFCCYTAENLSILEKVFNDFSSRKKIMFLTHCDIDHTGICDCMDEIYVSEKTYQNFALEIKGEKGYREQNHIHSPYKKISEIITSYQTPNITKMKVLRDKNEIGEKIGEYIFGDLKFDIFSGNGGHIPGEIFLVENEKKLIFTGDIFVNIKGFSDKQAYFNSFAPYLLPSVNLNSEKAKECREFVTKKYEGYLACPGHGKWCIL